MTTIKLPTSTNKNQWSNRYSIFCFGYGGTLYNASNIGAIDESINNEFASESDAWDCLNNLNGLNARLALTVLPVRVFVG